LHDFFLLGLGILILSTISAMAEKAKSAHIRAVLSSRYERFVE